MRSRGGGRTGARTVGVDAALRVVDVICVFVSAALPSAARLLPAVALAALVAASTRFAAVARLGSRIRARASVFTALAAVCTLRLTLLYISTRALPPAAAACAAACAAPLVASLEVVTVTPLLALVALGLLGRDAAATPPPPLLALAKRMRLAYRRRWTHRKIDAGVLNGTLRIKADAHAGTGYTHDEARVERPVDEETVTKSAATEDKSGAGTDDAQLERPAEENGAKMPPPALLDNASTANTTSSGLHVTRRTLAVVEKDADIKTEPEPDVAVGDETADNDDAGVPLSFSELEAGPGIGTVVFSLICMLAVGLLADGGNEMTRAVVLDGGDSGMAAFTVALMSCVALIPWWILDSLGWLPLFLADDGADVDGMALLYVGVLGTGLFLLPPVLIRLSEGDTSRSSSIVLASSPHVTATASGSSTSVFRISLSRLRTVTMARSSSVLTANTVSTLIATLALHALATSLLGYQWDASWLSVMAGVVVLLSARVQAQSTFIRSHSHVSMGEAKRIFRSFRTIVMESIEAMRMFIVQSQANRASWQVLNFFLFQAGMVLLESLYALTTHSTGLILVSADNIFCCVALALALYTIRRTATLRRAGDDVSRCDSLAGFANGVLLVYVAVLVVLEAVERHIERGNEEFAHTLTVCALGTLGNVTGLVFFPRSSRRHDDNVQGIYLHIWGNTLAFVGVALCAVTAQYAKDTLVLGVAGALAVAAIIVALAVPLLARSVRVLCAPSVRALPGVAQTLRAIPGVRDAEQARIWLLPTGGAAAAVRVYTTERADIDAITRAGRDALTSAGAKRARTVVEVLGAGRHERAPSFSARLNMMELDRGGLASQVHTSAHRRSQSSSRLELA